MEEEYKFVIYSNYKGKLCEYFNDDLPSNYFGFLKMSGLYIEFGDVVGCTTG